MQPGNYSKFWEDTLINDPAFWDKYHLRKTRAWAQTYDPVQQLTEDSFPLYQKNRRFVDIGIGARMNTDARHKPFTNAPYQLSHNAKKPISIDRDKNGC